MHFRAYADSDYPPDATIAARQFAVCDFVLGTTTAVYAYVTTDGTDAKVSHLYIKVDWLKYVYINLHISVIDIMATMHGCDDRL